MPTLVNKSAALRKLTHHQHVPGVGFVDHGCPPALGPGAAAAKNCRPAKDAADGSRHRLISAGGAAVEMVWVRAESAWKQPDGRARPGNRMAWTADHLGRAGWQYSRKL